MDIIITISSGMVSSFGIAGAVCNMTYFRSEKYQLHTAETSTRHLYKMLNMFDFAVCASTLFFLLHGTLLLFPEEFKIPSGYYVFYTVMNVSVDIAGFLTCMLVVARFINTVWSSYLLDCFAMTIAVVIFGAVAAGTETGPYIFSTNYHTAFVLKFLLLSLIFIVVMGLNLVTLTKLKSVQSEEHNVEERKQTTHTVMLLSILYCLFNFGNLVVLVNNIVGDKFNLPERFRIISIYVILPLKSACNPVLYFARNEEMRMWMSNQWRKLTMGHETSDKELEQLSSRKEEITRRHSRTAANSSPGSRRSSRHYSTSSTRSIRE
ncbi:hypothetical protein ACHWQZ_G015243 [Mnemiopsis leidyi]